MLIKIVWPFLRAVKCEVFMCAILGCVCYINVMYDGFTKHAQEIFFSSGTSLLNLNRPTQLMIE